MDTCDLRFWLRKQRLIAVLIAGLQVSTLVVLALKCSGGFVRRSAELTVKQLEEHSSPKKLYRLRPKPRKNNKSKLQKKEPKKAAKEG